MHSPPVLFVGAIRHFVEGHIVVRTRSRRATSGEFMTHRSLFLSSAALLMPLYPAAAQQAQQPSVPAAQAPAATTPPAQTDAVQAPAAPAAAGAAQPVDEEGDEEEIVITGAKPRGSVVGDIPPENTLDARDVRATGATNITELLDAIAPQIGSARGRGGGRPPLLPHRPRPPRLPRGGGHPPP